MMPWEPTREIMRRTMDNLRFIERHASEPNGPYEVTQLINSFLGAVAHPWERFRNDLLTGPLAAAVGWPKLLPEKGSKEPLTSVGDLIRLLRNALAHGNIEFLPNRDGSISALRLSNLNRGQVTWRQIISLQDMRMFLDRFVELAEEMQEQDIRSRKVRA